ncbi:Smr domain (Small MutS like) containing protein [gamma proteobacterium IMCC1989]|nr:Smr domain (Small MutS like) containing protein [gamma proteobacterium IMCC1989]
MNNDDDDFFKEMQDVKPLQREKRVVLNTSKIDKNTLKARQQAAQFEDVSLNDPLVDSAVEQLDANAMLEYQRPGVQHGVYKQLRQGKYSIEARLDLHRMTAEQARLTLYQFVRDCITHDIRCALITHGKGEGRANPAVLKSLVAHWLPQIDEVLAFHSAQKHHGGTGATYLLLKKSEKKRLENLELHQKRR